MPYTHTKYASFSDLYAVVTQNHISVRRYLRYSTPNHDSAAPEDSCQLSLIDAALCLLTKLTARAGIGSSACTEMVIRDLARREGVGRG
jgi:hypothetical protein